jgi:hypothetical protein
MSGNLKKAPFLEEPMLSQEEIFEQRKQVDDVLDLLAKDKLHYISMIINDYFNDFLVSTRNSGAFTDAELKEIDKTVDNELNKIKISIR